VHEALLTGAQEAPAHTEISNCVSKGREPRQHGKSTVNGSGTRLIARRWEAKSLPLGRSNESRASSSTESVLHEVILFIPYDIAPERASAVCSEHPILPSPNHLVKGSPLFRLYPQSCDDARQARLASELHAWAAVGISTVSGLDMNHQLAT
jgi:hypothetical protein